MIQSDVEGRREVAGALPATRKDIPFLVHVMNLTGLFVLAALLLLAGVIHLYQLVIVLPVLVLLFVYWRFRTVPNVVMLYFSLTMVIVAWIILCENIVIIDNIFGTQITRKLQLGLDLQPMLRASSDTFIAADYAAENLLTVSVTRFVIDAMKSTFKRRLVGTPPQKPSNSLGDGQVLQGMVMSDISSPAQPDVEIRPGGLLDWAKAGMSITHDEYNRLVRQIEQLGSTAKVILLYNPSGYEIYRDILIGSHQEFDEVAAFQVDAQRAFAAAHGWGFVDLTEPLRGELSASRAWIYGRYDRTHWSPQGTAIVANVLARELSRAVGQP